MERKIKHLLVRERDHTGLKKNSFNTDTKQLKGQTTRGDKKYKKNHLPLI